MTEEIRRRMLTKCEAVDRHNDAVLAAHPESPRYCYSCQCWLENEAATRGHAGHSIH